MSEIGRKLIGRDIDLICQNKVEYMFLASLISSDNIRTIEDAEKALNLIDEVEEALKTSTISTEKKKEFEKYITKGREILNNDIKEFNN